MAWVMNKAHPGDVLDKPYKHYNRTNAGDPQAAVTPQYAGERILDITNGVQYQSLGKTNDTWVDCGAEGPE